MNTIDQILQSMEDLKKDFHNDLITELQYITFLEENILVLGKVRKREIANSFELSVKKFLEAPSNSAYIRLEKEWKLRGIKEFRCKFLDVAGAREWINTFSEEEVLKLK